MSRTRILEDLNDGVLVLTLNRPERKNAFDETMWRETRDALADAQRDDAVRCVIVTGAGEAFSAGQDLGQMAARPDNEPPGFPGFMDRLVAFDKPLLAAVNGVGVGIGLTMLLHCDVVWMAEEARLRAPFVPLGVVPEAASSYLLPLQLGHQRAAEMLFLADWIDAQRARRTRHRDARRAAREPARRDARAGHAHRRAAARRAALDETNPAGGAGRGHPRCARARRCGVHGARRIAGESGSAARLLREAARGFQEGAADGSRQGRLMSRPARSEP